MTLGEIINEYRTSHCMSMDKFAERSGLSKSYISMLEKNHDQRGNIIKPRLETIKKVAIGVGKSFEEVFNSLDDAQIVIVNSVGNTMENVAGILPFRQRQFERIMTYYEKLSDIEAEALEKFPELSNEARGMVVAMINSAFEQQTKKEELKAAHARTDIETTKEMKQHDYDIMKGDDF